MNPTTETNDITPTVYVAIDGNPSISMLYSELPDSEKEAYKLELQLYKCEFKEKMAVWRSCEIDRYHLAEADNLKQQLFGQEKVSLLKEELCQVKIEYWKNTAKFHQYRSTVASESAKTMMDMMHRSLHQQYKKQINRITANIKRIEEKHAAEKASRENDNQKKHDDHVLK